MAKTPLVHDERTISMTVSIGVATIDPHDSEIDQKFSFEQIRRSTAQKKMGAIR